MALATHMGGPASARRAVITALLIAASVLTKHNLVLVPLLVTLDVLRRGNAASRYAYVATGAVCATLALVSLWLVAGGVIVGIPAALAVARLLKSSLVGVEATDPWTAAGAMGVLMVVAMLAAWVPARRAAAIEPMAALREE